MTEQSKATNADPSAITPDTTGETEPVKVTAEDSNTGSTAPVTSTTLVEQLPGEIGGPRGPEPTRYGDWEAKGRCSDF